MRISWASVPAAADDLVATFREIAAINLDDGIVFDPESVRAMAIREEGSYGGLRVRTGRRAWRAELARRACVWPRVCQAVLPIPLAAECHVLM
jgi:hypothetical protein